VNLIHSNFHSKESTDYTILFYIMDICSAIAILLCLRLNVKIDPSGQTTKEALKKIWSKPAIIFFTFQLLYGIMWGVHDTYVIAHLSDELGASSRLISKIHNALKRKRK
jgi:hypothetical protein